MLVGVQRLSALRVIVCDSQPIRRMPSLVPANDTTKVAELGRRTYHALQSRIPSEETREWQVRVGRYVQRSCLFPLQVEEPGPGDHGAVVEGKTGRGVEHPAVSGEASLYLGP